MEDRLADEIDEAIDLLGSNPDPAPLARRLVGRANALRLAGASLAGPLTLVGLKLVQQPRYVFVFAVAAQLAAHHVDRAQQRVGKLGGEIAAGADSFQHVLDRVGGRLQIVEAKHPGAALDRVSVSKERIDRVPPTLTRLECEER